MLGIVKMSDEVTVSSLPHPISMFFLGTFTILIIYVITEVNKFKKNNDKIKDFMETFKSELENCKKENESKLSDISKKIDSRVDKALLSFKKQSKIQE